MRTDLRSTVYDTAHSIQNEALRLKILHRAFADALEEAHDRTQSRIVFLQSLKPWPEGLAELCDFTDYSQPGSPVRMVYAVAVVWSGRDCDGVQYSGEVRTVEASKAAVEAHIETEFKWADGPCNFHIERPSIARQIRYHSRDLALEAFEDGHSGCISSARFDEEGDYHVD